VSFWPQITVLCICNKQTFTIPAFASYCLLLIAHLDIQEAAVTTGFLKEKDDLENIKGIGYCIFGLSTFVCDYRHIHRR
jgi:hypothetical protein